MIEISLQLKLDTFLVNSMGKSEDISSQNSAKALKLVCEQILSGRLMTESKPTADFEFMAVSNNVQVDADKEFDGKLLAYLKRTRQSITPGQILPPGLQAMLQRGKG